MQRDRARGSPPCGSLCQPTPARTKGSAGRYLLCVSVVVVVVGPGVVVCCDVVVVLCVPSEAQPDTNARATTVRQEMIIFFMSKL